METKSNMVAVGLDELGLSLNKGDMVECPAGCGEKHSVALSKDSEGVESNLLMFVRCGDKYYAVGIDGKEWK